ncbi:protein regulator of cytokinesis 1-like isoform X2 [Gigantopelta aegis]|uniref:protein regulator of cytokinesis 1-like isoform X2 n=1 Tax=Gigantopelta aegis TaxID=1735272 RepID=UPI001B88B30F|nr:protein regulator of cytokinesis 1-like isoform X2 [Gigantopelta aegis]
MAGFRPDIIRMEVVEKLDVCFGTLYKIWTDIGICESQMDERARQVYGHLDNLLDEMVEEESVLRDQIQQNIQEYAMQVSTLCVELHLPPYKQKDGMSMIQKEKDLRAKLNSLKAEKSERLRLYKSLKLQDQHLCDVLQMTPYYIPSGTVPTTEQLSELEKHLDARNAEKQDRQMKFVSTKKKIIELFNELECNPDTSFEREIICEDDDSFVLSAENMMALKNLYEELENKNDSLKEATLSLWSDLFALWNRLDVPEEEREAFKVGKDGHKPAVLEALRAEIARCEALKFENIQRFVDGIRTELQCLWGKCFFNNEQRERFKFMHEDTYTEELLKVHENELEEVKSYYNTYKDLFDKLEKWEALFQERVEIERKAMDPNRYKNRRHNYILQDEKAMKKVQKELPKVEEEVRNAVHEWQQHHKKAFLVEGMSFTDYVKQKWDAYHEEKIREKEQRQIAKAKLIQDEMAFGSRPTTPSKRALCGTPSKTPNKYRKLNETKTPGSVSRIQHSSIFASPYGRAPLSSSKAPNRSLRRRSKRLARQVLSECKNNNNTKHTKNNTIFSQTTVSSNEGSSINMSLASTGSYQDFAVPKVVPRENTKPQTVAQ